MKVKNGRAEDIEITIRAHSKYTLNIVVWLQCGYSILQVIFYL